MARAGLIWGALALVILWALGAAALSPYLAYRAPVYVAGGFAGIVGLVLIALQPLLASGRLPGLPPRRGRRAHRWIGAGLVVAVAAHVAGLWITSPPDMVDALTLTAPTLFSVFGVVSLWAILGAAALALLRPRLGPRAFRPAHAALVLLAVAATVAHAVLIEGAMGWWSKLALSALALGAAGWAVAGLRPFRTAAPRPRG